MPIIRDKNRPIMLSREIIEDIRLGLREIGLLCKITLETNLGRILIHPMNEKDPSIEILLECGYVTKKRESSTMYAILPNLSKLLIEKIYSE